MKMPPLSNPPTDGTDPTVDSAARPGRVEAATGGTLLAFSDDWGRHPSSCQHLARHLIDRHMILWVNTIGTRPPRFDFETVRRTVGKLRHWVRPNGASGIDGNPSGPIVLNPKMWP